MSWQKWTLIALYVVSALLTVATIGRPRKPLEAGTAVAVLIIDALLVLLVVTA